MSTLNASETESLRKARAEISAVANRLRDEERPITAADRKLMADLLKQADDKVKTVVTVKGHYPK